MTPAGSSGTQPEITASPEKALTPLSGPLLPQAVAPSLGGRESPVSSPQGDGDALKTPGPGCGQDGEHGAHGPAPAVVSPPHKGRVGLSSQVGKISGDVWAALGTWKALQRQPIWLIKQG